MSSYITPGVLNPLSDVTLGALHDLGYATNPIAGDYFLIAPLNPLAPRVRPQPIHIVDRVSPPRGTIDSHGVVHITPE